MTLHHNACYRILHFILTISITQLQLHVTISKGMYLPHFQIWHCNLKTARHCSTRIQPICRVWVATVAAPPWKYTNRWQHDVLTTRSVWLLQQTQDSTNPRQWLSSKQKRTRPNTTAKSRFFVLFQTPTKTNVESEITPRPVPNLLQLTVI